jgi:oligosaccharide translocation protein RFT1
MAKPPDSASENVLPPRPTAPSSQGSALRGASLLIILQIVSRAVTFIANQLLLRFLTAQLLGVSTQLEVYYLSVLFFARESLRVAIQRQGGSATDAPRESQSVVNIGHIASVLGAVAAAGLGAIYWRYVDAATASTPYLQTGLWVYGLAAIVELLSEPAFVVLQHRLRFGPRAAAESIATFVRCAVTFGAANWSWRAGKELGVLPFALGQLGYGVVLLLVYLLYGWSLAGVEGFSLFPRRILAPPRQSEGRETKIDGATTNDYTLGYFYTPTLHLASSMTAQSLVKHILTQGDTFLVSILSTTKVQGLYALANNYGSLLARLVFQPVEESSRSYFSKLLSTSSPAASSTTPADKNVPPKRALEKARTDLQALLKSYTLLSVLILTLGPFGAPLLVQLIAGRAWASSGAGWVLAQYCLYIPLLALNGITEAFVSSVASEAEVHRQSLWMGAFSVAFASAGFVFLRVLGLGAAGLVYANAINMLCRIAWSGHFISAWFGGKGVAFSWGEIVPTGLGVYVVATGVLWQALVMGGVSLGAVSRHIFRDLVTVCGMALPYVALV